MNYFSILLRRRLEGILARLLRPSAESDSRFARNLQHQSRRDQRVLPAQLAEAGGGGRNLFDRRRLDLLVREMLILQGSTLAVEHATQVWLHQHRASANSIPGIAFQSHDGERKSCFVLANSIHGLS